MLSGIPHVVGRFQCWLEDRRAEESNSQWLPSTAGSETQTTSWVQGLEACAIKRHLQTVVHNSSWTTAVWLRAVRSKSCVIVIPAEQDNLNMQSLAGLEGKSP